MNWLRAQLHVEPGEEMPVLLLFLYLALIFTSFLIIRTAKDALFLTKFNAETLAYLYVAVGVVMGLVIPLYFRITSRLGLAALITASLAFFMSNVLLLWLAARVRWSPLPEVFYVWSGIFGVAVPTQAWTVANRVLDVRQAKRLFPLISSGAMLGSVAGGLFASAMVKGLGTHNLLLILIPLLALCAFLARLLLRRYAYVKSGIQTREGATARTRGGEKLRKILVQSRYLRMIAIMLAISAVVTLLVQYQFMYVVKKQGYSRDQLTAFFGNFNAGMNLLAMVLQLSAGSRLAERFGVRVTLFILPMTLVTGTVLLLAFPMRLWTALLLRGGDQTLRYSIDKSAVELLYLPVPQKLKTDAKAVIDMMVLRLAEGVGGVLLLVLTGPRLLHLGPSAVGVFNLVLISIWLWVAFLTRREYVSAIKASISERSVLPKSALRLVFDDPGSMATVRSMLESDDEEVVLYAMDLARALGQPIPAGLISHASPRVRLKATELAGISVPQLLDRVRRESSSVVGAGAIKSASRMLRPNQPISALEEYLRTPELKVRLSALVCLARQGVAAERWQEHLHSITAELKTCDEWSDFFQALGEIQNPATAGLYMRLFDHPDPAVRKQAALSAGRAGHRELVPALVRLLGDPEVASEARRALRAVGPRILGTLADVMKDPSENIEVRRSIPRILAYVPHQEAVETLLDGLFDYDSVVADRSLRALSKLRLVDSTLRFDPERVHRRIRDEGEQALWYRRAFTCLYPEGQSADLLARLLRERIDRATDHVFRLLALILPPTTVHVSFLVLGRDDRTKKASVVEYLDNVLPSNLKNWVLPLIELKAAAPGEGPDRGEVLEALLKSSELALRECAAAAITRNHWTESVARGSAVSPM